MTMKISCLKILLALGSLTQAHMQMSWPPPFRSMFNPYTEDIDYSMTSPLSSDGSDYPCKSYLQLFDTRQGQSVVTWQPGQTYNFTLAGTVLHAGGSCQASMSFDRGRRWKVIHSYIGKCPLKSDWHFTLPNDTPSGDAIFAWTWFNNLGNREMYMNCARVTIGKRSVDAGDPPGTFSERPGMFVANVGNGCTTTEGRDLAFPKPGPDVVYDSNNTYPPSGQCKTT